MRDHKRRDRRRAAAVASAWGEDAGNGSRIMRTTPLAASDDALASSPSPLEGRNAPSVTAVSSRVDTIFARAYHRPARQ
jgi:hypothetical protein